MEPSMRSWALAFWCTFLVISGYQGQVKAWNTSTPTFRLSEGAAVVRYHPCAKRHGKSVAGDPGDWEARHRRDHSTEHQLSRPSAALLAPLQVQDVSPHAGAREPDSPKSSGAAASAFQRIRTKARLLNSETPSTEQQSSDSPRLGTAAKDSSKDKQKSPAKREAKDSPRSSPNKKSTQRSPNSSRPQSSDSASTQHSGVKSPGRSPQRGRSPAPALPKSLETSSSSPPRGSPSSSPQSASQQNKGTRRASPPKDTASIPTRKSPTTSPADRLGKPPAPPSTGTRSSPRPMHSPTQAEVSQPKPKSGRPSPQGTPKVPKVIKEPKVPSSPPRKAPPKAGRGPPRPDGKRSSPSPPPRAAQKPKAGTPPPTSQTSRTQAAPPSQRGKPGPRGNGRGGQNTGSGKPTDAPHPPAPRIARGKPTRGASKPKDAPPSPSPKRSHGKPTGGSSNPKPTPPSPSPRTAHGKPTGGSSNPKPAPPSPSPTTAHGKPGGGSPRPKAPSPARSRNPPASKGTKTTRQPPSKPRPGVPRPKVTPSRPRGLPPSPPRTELKPKMLGPRPRTPTTTPRRTRRPPPVSYWGGPVMVRPMNVYIIFYGNWPVGSCGRSVLATMVTSISDPSLSSLPGPTVPKWWRMVVDYTQKDGKKATSQVRLARTIQDSYSMGKWLTGPRGNNSVLSVLERALARGLLPVDEDAAYMVLTSADVKVGQTGAGFCSLYCGWHTFTNYKGKLLKYGFAGNGATQCPDSTCNLHLETIQIPGQRISPNMCWGPDGMATNMLHELAEIATDPYFDAWHSNDGIENADYCYRSVQKTLAMGGSRYNLIAAKGRKFLVQSMLNVHTMLCQHP